MLNYYDKFLYNIIVNFFQLPIGLIFVSVPAWKNYFREIMSPNDPSNFLNQLDLRNINAGLI